MDSAAFKVIVGESRFTPGGAARGTIFDATSPHYLEFKGGSSILDSTYQLRLQTYMALRDSQKYISSPQRGRWRRNSLIGSHGGAGRCNGRAVGLHG
jgi:hypothetical protein